MIAAVLSAPYDLDQLKNIDAFVAAYNPRSISLDAVIEVLLGKTKAEGSLPVK